MAEGSSSNSNIRPIQTNQVDSSEVLVDGKLSSVQPTLFQLWGQQERRRAR